MVNLAQPVKWSEDLIAGAVAFNLLPHSVLVVPNCGWTGAECDLLVVDKSLRVIDVEIKISRADLKADVKKDKWWVGRQWSQTNTRVGLPRGWPPKVWRHYYVMPRDIWTPELLDSIPTTSGVVTMRYDERVRGSVSFAFQRKVTSNPDVAPISAGDAIDLARLTSLRMWTRLANK